MCRVTMEAKTIRTRLQELAFLNSEATIWFRALQPSSASSPSSTSSSNKASSSGASSSIRSSSNGNGAAPHAEAPPAAASSSEGAAQGWEKLHFSGGLREYVKHLNRDLQPMHEPLYISEKVNDDVGKDARTSSVRYKRRSEPWVSHKVERPSYIVILP